MGELIAIWRASGTLTQILAVVFVVYGVLKGIIVLPAWIRLKKKPIPTHDLSVHSQCVNFPSLKLVVIRAIEKSAEIQRILINDTLNEQMNEADDLLNDVKEILRQNYLLLYKHFKKQPEMAGILSEKDVQHYDALLQGMDHKLKGMARRFLKRNHFTEKSEEEFRLYIAKRTEDFQRAASQYLDERYDTNTFGISREHLFKSNKETCMPEIQKKISEFFYNARDIASAKELEVEKLRNDISDFL